MSFQLPTFSPLAASTFGESTLQPLQQAPPLVASFQPRSALQELQQVAPLQPLSQAPLVPLQDLQQVPLQELQQVPLQDLPQALPTHSIMEQLPLSEQQIVPEQSAEDLAYQPKHVFTPLSAQFMSVIVSPNASRVYATKQQRVSLEEFITEISVEWLENADNKVVSVVTPWSLESTREGNPDLLGLARPGLPIRVVVSNQEQQFVHQMTEGLMLGILSVLYDIPAFSFYLEDTINKIPQPLAINLGDILGNYNNETSRGKYSATLKCGSVIFDTLDVLQGIITAAQWLKQDPHSYVQNLTEGGKSLNF